MCCQVGIKRNEVIGKVLKIKNWDILFGYVLIIQAGLDRSSPTRWRIG